MVKEKLVGKSFGYSLTLADDGYALLVAQLGRMFEGKDWEYFRVEIPMPEKGTIPQLSEHTAHVLTNFTKMYGRQFEEGYLKSNDGTFIQAG